MRSALLATAWLAAAAAPAQETQTGDSTGLPGDHFNLPGALDAFRHATTLEAFEKVLNDPESKVNNLDLNNDGNTDYIRVVDHASEGAHAIVLQVPVSKTEAQDVAVIELEKKGDRSAAVEIRGDEDLYGKEVIIAPTEGSGDEPAQPKHGPAPPPEPRPAFFVNVWAWPCVTWIYGPDYMVWVSPWYWDYYPYWWHPWHPHPWHTWWGWHHGYYGYNGWCGPTTVVYVERAHTIYRPHHTRSPMVMQRMHQQQLVTPQPGRLKPQSGTVRPHPQKPDPTVAPGRKPKPEVQPKQAPPHRLKPSPAPAPQKQRVRKSPAPSRGSPNRLTPRRQ